MPTDIYFAGASVRIKVDEGPSQVAEAFNSADGLPFCLTDHDTQAVVYINPTTVAFWSISEPAPTPEASQEVAQSGRERDPTDIWGQPLRRRPRR